MSDLVIVGTWQDNLKDIADESVDLIIIDPPYLTTKEKWDKEEVVNDELSRQLFRIAKPSCSLYVWCGIGEKSQSLIRWFPVFAKHWHFKDLITWKKQRGIGMRKGWLYTREELLWFVKDNKKFVWNKEEQYDLEDKRLFSLPNNKSDFKRWSNVWTDIKEVAGGMKSAPVDHFTPKPEKAIERIIKLHTKEGDTVFDCFAGSGTTGIVAKRMNREYVLIEKEPEYISLITEGLANV